MWKNRGFGKNKSSNFRGRSRGFGKDRRGPAKTFNKRRSPDRVRSSQGDRRGSRFNNDRKLMHDVNTDRNQPLIYEDGRKVIDRESMPLTDVHSFDTTFDDQFPVRDEYRANDSDRYSPNFGHVKEEDQFLVRRDEFDNVGRDSGFDNVYREDDYGRGVDLKYDRPFTDYVGDDTVGRRFNDEPFRDDDFNDRNDNYQYGENLRDDYQNRTGNRNELYGARESNYGFGSHDIVKTEFKTENYDNRDHKNNRTAGYLSGERNNTDRNKKRNNFDRENKSNRDRHTFDNRLDSKTRKSDSTSSSRRDHASKEGRHIIRDHRENIRGSENNGKLFDKRPSSATVSEKSRKTDSSGRSNSSSRQKDSRTGTKSHSSNTNNVKYSKGREDSHRNSAISKSNSSSDRRRPSSLSKTSENDRSKRSSNKETESNSGDKHKSEDKKRRVSDDKTPRSGGLHSERDKFKKPAERQQTNTTNRSSSGRRTETNIGHYNEDDILSIMAEDDGFDIEHRFGNTSTRTASPRRSGRDSAGKNISSNRSSRDNYQRQKNISESERNIEPLFEIHADSSASIFDESTDRVKNYGNVRTQSSNRGHSKDRKSDNRNIKSSSSKPSDRSRNDRHSVKKSEQSSKVSHVSNTKNEPGCIRHELGKTGALLREDRPSANVSKARSRFQSQRQNRNFNLGTSRGSIVSKSRFSSRNFNHSDRLKKKYLKGGLRGTRDDRNFSRGKGYEDRKQSMGRDKREKRDDSRKKRGLDNKFRSDRDNKSFNDMSANVDDNKGRFDNFADSQVNTQQQIVFIPNADLDHGLPTMVDQFGQPIYNASIADPSMEGQVPMRYVSEQYPGDASTVGEHLVFIPFVNQVPNYPENMSNIPDNNVVNEVKSKEEKPKSSIQTKPKPKPLSDLKKLAIKRKLALKRLKRKQRMEAEIERNLLKKLFENKEVLQAVKGQSSGQVRKKPVIRRISPPVGNKPTHANKTIKLVKKVNNAVDVSDEDGDKYDSVSDLEDVSDEEEYEDRKGKRPTFRKPGEPRKGTRNVAESQSKMSNVTGRKESDVRRVVQASSNRSWEQSENGGQKRQRSMYSDQIVSYDQTNRSTHSSARSSVKKVRRSRSPIEITVSNERFSSTVSGNQRNTGDKDRKKIGYRNTELRNESGRDNDNKYDGKRYGGFDGHDRDDSSRLDRHQRDNSSSKFESHKNVRNSHSGSENSGMSNDRNFSTGKYNDDDNFGGRGRNDMSRNRNDGDRTKAGSNERSSNDRGFGYRNEGGNFQKDYEGTGLQSPRFQNEYHTDNSQGGESSSHFNTPPYQRSYRSNQHFPHSPPDDGHSFSPYNPVQHQFTAVGGVDHSLPPVQNAPVPVPPYPPASMGGRPDMSLPPPVGGNSPMMHPSNTGNIQQNYGLQSQQYQSIHQQYPQQQQMQVINQNQSQYQLQQQPVFTSGHSQMGVQQIQPNQFQQNQSNVGMVPLNPTRVSGHVTQQMSAPVRQVNQGSFKQVINTSNSQHAFVATNSQGVRGVIGTIKTSGTASQQGLRMAHVETGSQVQPAMTTNVSDGIPSLLRLPQEDESYSESLVQMICSKCNSVLLDHIVMKSHSRWHDMIESNTKHLRCDQCEQGFSTGSAYSNHMSQKHTYHSWNCSLCDLTFSNSSALNKHIRHSSHKNFKVKFVCSLCPASFMVLTHLVQHKKDSHQSDSTYSAYKKF
ncbi:hypothetical protein ACF0H5_015251 [Mactra antiquata]